MKTLLVLLSPALALAAFADEQPDPKKLPPLPFKEEKLESFRAPGIKVEGFYSGSLVTVDEAFTTKYEHAPPETPFSVVYDSKDKNIYSLAGGKKMGGVPELLRFSLATEDKKAIEIVRFTDLTVARQQDNTDRLKLCAWLLNTQGVKMATRGYQDPKYIETYATKIGGNDAVCVHGHMTKPDTGEHYALKLVGILHPKTNGGVLASLMANTDLSEIKKPEDLSSKGVSLRIIHSLRFVDAAKNKVP
jgi:hypothetical protein